MLFNVKKDISKRTFIVLVICLALIVIASFLYFGNKYLGFFGGTSDTSDTNPQKTTEGYAEYEYELTAEGISITKYNGTDKDVAIPDKIDGIDVVEIGQGAFARNDTISSLIIPDTVTLINIEAFSTCPLLENVTLPQSLVTIAYSAFGMCQKLKEITFPSQVNIVGDNAFYGCTSLENITLSDNILYFGASVFDGTAWHQNTEDGIVTIGNILYEYRGDMPKEYTLTIPSGVKTIASGAFYGRINIIDIKWAESLKNIGRRAFADCIGLSAINLTEGIRRIGEGAFEYCDLVTNIFVSSTVTEIDEGAFFACPKLKKVKVADENLYFYSDGSALYTKDKARLLLFCPLGEETDYVVPDTVTNLDKGAFYGCEKIKNLTLSESLAELPLQAFFGCASITSFVVPDSVTTIHDFAFYGCESLVYVRLPESLEKYGNNVFSSCKNLETLSISEDCESLTTENGTLFSKDKSVLYTFPAANAYTQYTVPQSVERIAEGAFSGAIKLTKIELPKTLKSISNKAFFECESLSSITIPANVTEIGSLAFKGCISLKKITIGESVAYIEADAFVQCYSLKNIYVQEGNTNFTVLDSVLYSADKTKLVCYPSRKSGKTFTLPETVTAIKDYAFYGCFYLEKITLHPKVEQLAASSFYKCPALKAFVLDGDGENFSVYEGVLYDADMTTLIKYPSDKSGSFFTIPETILFLQSYTFENCTMLRKIKIGSSMLEMMSDSFYEMDSLKIVCVKDSYAHSYAVNYGFDYELS